jgi:rhodanese-related sulfurtransferase
MRARGDSFLFLDVREPHEFETARIEGTQLVPLATVAARAEEFAEWKHGTVVVHCYKGGRSARACKTLAQHGFTDVWNLTGGIEAWSLTVDPDVPRY